MASFPCVNCGVDMGWDRPSCCCSERCLRLAQGFGDELEYPAMVEKTVREWPQWSRAEQSRIDEIVSEVLDHVCNGAGNPFIREWCDKFIPS